MATQTVLLITQSDNNEFSNSWVSPSRETAVASIMDAIIDWVQDEIDIYRRFRVTFPRFEKAWKLRDLEELVASWNTMSSMNFVVEKHEIDLDPNPVDFPEFPGDYDPDAGAQSLQSAA